MVLLKPVVVGFFKNSKDDLETANNVVRLSESDSVCDVPPEVAVPEAPNNAPSKFAASTEAQDALTATEGSKATVDHVSPSESAQPGLDADQTLGELITGTRKQRGLSRERVTEQTRIPAHYVRMIESDSYDAVPDELYLLPFIRRYAIFLGLDSQKVVSRFIRDFEKIEHEIVSCSEQSVPAAKTQMIWERVSFGALIVLVLIPCLGWVMGSVRTTVSHPANSLSAVATSTTPLAPSKILSTDAPLVVAVQQPAQAVTAVTASPPIATTSAGPKIDQQRTPTGQHMRRSRRPRHRRRAMRHRHG